MKEGRRGEGMRVEEREWDVDCRARVVVGLCDFGFVLVKDISTPPYLDSIVFADITLSASKTE